MKKVTIAFDIDGTLRKNSEERHRTEVEVNRRIIDLLTILATFKNVELHLWSNRGGAYCWEMAQAFQIHDIIKQSRCHLKGWYAQQQKDFVEKGAKPFVPDIAIDDQQRFDGGIVNLIVREK